MIYRHLVGTTDLLPFICKKIKNCLPAQQISTTEVVLAHAGAIQIRLLLLLLLLLFLGGSIAVCAVTWCNIIKCSRVLSCYWLQLPIYPSASAASTTISQCSNVT